MPGGVRRHDGREPTLGGGERFTELELGEILRRAAERQEGVAGEPDGRFSLAEIQQISVYLAPTDVAAIVGLTTSVGGVGAAVGIGLALGTTAVCGGPLAIAATIAVSLGWAGAGTWVAMRAIWRRMARRWEDRTNALGTQLVTAAQRAIDAARTDNE